MADLGDRGSETREALPEDVTGLGGVPVALKDPLRGRVGEPPGSLGKDTCGKVKSNEADCPLRLGESIAKLPFGDFNLLLGEDTTGVDTAATTAAAATELSRLAMARLRTRPCEGVAPLELGELNPTPLKLFLTLAVVLGRLDGLVNNEVPESRLLATLGEALDPSATFTALAFATRAIFLMSFSLSSQDLMSGPPKTLLPSTCASTKVAPRLR